MKNLQRVANESRRRETYNKGRNIWLEIYYDIANDAVLTDQIISEDRVTSRYHYVTTLIRANTPSEIKAAIKDWLTQ